VLLFSGSSSLGVGLKTGSRRDSDRSVRVNTDSNGLKLTRGAFLDARGGMLCRCIITTIIPIRNTSRQNFLLRFNALFLLFVVHDTGNSVCLPCEAMDLSLKSYNFIISSVP
jgi:hypothetical protein